MSGYGRRVLRFWVIRPSECAETGDPEGGYWCFVVADRKAHSVLGQQERRVAHDAGAGARWLPWAVCVRLGDHGFDLSRGARAGWSAFAANILRYEVIQPLHILENRLDPPARADSVRTTEGADAVTVNA